jgi:uncharacterized protein with HEPN domain
MSKDPKQFLKHIHDECKYLLGVSENLSYDEFYTDETLKRAVVRSLEIIGEAANNIQRVDPEFATKNAAIPWKVMYAMRNRLSHGYEKVDNEMVWNTVCEDLPALQSQVEKVSSQIMD